MYSRIRAISLFVLISFLSAHGQQPKVFTWTSNNCSDCQSTILFPNWFTDGTGLFAEGLSSDSTYAVAAITLQNGYLVVALGLGMVHEPSVSINPREAVTLETDTASNMVLYAIKGQIRGLPKGDITYKKRILVDNMTITTGKPAVGFLFFPDDAEAKQVTVVITVGNETLRLPFKRNPNARAKFVDKAKIFSTEAVQPQEAISSSDHNNSDILATGSSDTKGTLNPGNANMAGLANSEGDSLRAVQTGTCNKNISFAVAEGGQIVSRSPKFTKKWIEKNAKKYPGLCFSQTPNPQAVNYVVVFSTSQSAFDGIYPTVRTTTNTNSSPVYGNGTVTDNYGSMWNYTYNGTATTTTTTTSEVNLPYRDTTNEIFAYSYDQNGRLVSQHWRTITTREGGDAMNTFGYNLGSALARIHLKERLLKDAIEDLVK